MPKKETVAKPQSTTPPSTEPPSTTQRVCVLGSTGSIGVSTLDVIARHPERFTAYALAAYKNSKALLEQCIAHKPKYAVLVDERAAAGLRESIKSLGLSIEVLAGPDALSVVSAHEEVDVVMAAIVGAAGLEPNLAAAKAGKRVLLANKESLVMSGELFMDAVAQSGSVLLPIDSEHNAIYQCLPSRYRCGDALSKDVRRILLTASGGPFREFNLEQLKEVTPAQACAHPNWDMGQKISVDSASLMNKGLELIEACWLFNIQPKDIEVHVHPESIIHSMVEYLDGSVLAQMGNPDMRTPIAYGLAWPERIDAGVESLNLFDIGRLNFQEPDTTRFPCLDLAKEAFDIGGTACSLLNAANETAVDAFLKGNISFTSIPDTIKHVLEHIPAKPADSIECVLDADRHARVVASKYIEAN